jgi:hypothetical protein
VWIYILFASQEDGSISSRRQKRDWLYILKALSEIGDIYPLRPHKEMGLLSYQTVLKGYNIIKIGLYCSFN